MSLTEWGGAEQSAQLDRGRPFGFAQYNVFRGGPGSLSLSFGGRVSKGTLEDSCHVAFVLHFAFGRSAAGRHAH